MISFIDIVHLSMELILLFLLGGVLFICICCTAAIVYYIFVNRKALCNELRERR
jgi:hypothetical protein